MSIVLRGSKGSALTFAELDNNFSELSSGIATALAYTDSAILPAVSQSLHVGGIVASTIYDTSKDSDGGAWRKRCQHTSWYNEAKPAGRWLGQASSEAVARALSSGLVGSNLVTNGTFDSGTSGWTFANASVVEGKATFTGVVGGNVSQANVVASGKTYYISFTLNKTVGTMYLNVAGATVATFSSVSGNCSAVVTPSSAGAVSFVSNDTVGAIDNIVVKEVSTAAPTTGDYYQNSTDGKFYSLNAGSGATEIFRGARAEFPSRAAVVAETGRVVIYDLDTIGVPMWMVFVEGSNYILNNTGSYSSSLAYSSGKLIIGRNSTSAGTPIIDFASDKAVLLRSSGTGSYTSSSGLSARNSSFWTIVAPQYNIANTVVNSIAATVLPGAPIDPATGLAVPTIAVATLGGVSVIKSDRSVVNSLQTDAIRLSVYGESLWSDSTSSGPYLQVASLKNIAAGFAFINVSTPLSVGPPGAGSFTSVVAAAPLVSRGTSVGCVMLAHNPASPTKGMVAYITAAYPGMWQVGDSRRAWLCDATAETVTGTELVTNGTFATDTTGWNAGGGATLSVVSGALRVTNGASTTGYAYQTFSTVIGKQYVAQLTRIAGTATGAVNVGLLPPNGEYAANSSASSIAFTATSTNFTITCHTNSSVSGAYCDFDNISVRLAEPDRSVKNKSLPIYGSLTKTMVGGVAMYSGFSASNYLEEAYSSDLDFGTGDFSVILTFKTGADVTTDQYLFDRCDAGGGVRLNAYVGSSSLVLLTIAGGGTSYVLQGGILPNTPYSFCIGRNSAGLFILKDGVNTVTASLNPTVARNITSVTQAAPMSVGIQFVHDHPFLGAIALLRISATAPSADQIAQIYRDELALFQTGAVGTLAGSSSAVTALDYDDSTDLLHVGTSTHRSSFKGLVRVSSEATPSGAITSISAARGVLLTGGTSAYVAAPAVTVREAIEGKFKRVEQPVVQDYDAVTGQTAFVLPKGYTALTVKSAGTLKREGSTKDWTRSFDGYQESVVFGTAPGNTVWVQIEMVRAQS